MGFKHTPKEARKMWVDALRSGEYKQTTGELCDYDPATNANRYCCLGVACDLFLRHEAELETRRRDDGSITYDGEDSELPDVVRDWLGMEWCNGEQDHGDPLTEINDNGVSFVDIAYIIESAPPGLFVEDTR